jgi:hypothetical protein
MSYEKYIKKDGKLYGPYLYESKRVDGKVISEYHGQKKSDYVKFIWIIPLVFLIILGAYFIGQRGDKLTGHAVLDLNANYQEGKTLEGGLKISLKQGELIPAYSTVVFENAGNKYEYPLKELVAESTEQGDFFIAGKTLADSGEGFGISGTKEIYPEVKFTMIISSEVNAEEPSSEVVIANETIPEKETIPEEPIPAESEPPETTTGEENSASPLDIISNFFLGLTPTGNSILESQKEISASASAGNPFTYTLQDGERAEIKPLSVSFGSKQLSENDLSLTTDGNLVTVSTTYSEKEEGFGSDYSGNNVKDIMINIGNLNLSLEKGNLNIRVVYNNEELVSLQTVLGSGEIAVESEILPVEEPEIVNATTSANASVNNTVPVISEVLKLTNDEKNILIKEFGNISVKVTSAVSKNGFIIIRYEIGDYWIENSYDLSLDNLTLSSFMEADRIKLLKDIAQKLSTQPEDEKELNGYIGNYSY